MSVYVLNGKPHFAIMRAYICKEGSEMKSLRKTAAVVIMAAMAFSMCACSKAEKEKDEAGGDKKYEKKFGSYEVSEGWVEVSSHSNPPFYFSYCQDGHDKDDLPNNIAVYRGEDKYSADDIAFKDDILATLNRQVEGLEGTTVTGSGITSDKGYPVYMFEIKTPDDRTIQYYIAGEKEYVMVSAAIYDEDMAKEDKTEEVAKGIVDSFEWDDQGE